MNKANTQDELEGIVDALGVKGTLDALAQVCFDKSEHPASNWQDEAGAKIYADIGQAVNSFAYRIEQKFGFTGWSHLYETHNKTGNKSNRI